MSHRLTKIITRGGDRGETSLADGARLPKDDARITVIGEVDELNSWIGVVIAHLEEGTVAETLLAIQHDLFDLGGALAMPGAPLLTESHVKRIDEAAAALNADLPPLKEFILPGGATVIAFAHVARAVCRRCERAMTSFASENDAGYGPAYLNRLSDFLFIAARFEARRSGVAEMFWRRDRSLGG